MPKTIKDSRPLYFDPTVTGLKVVAETTQRIYANGLRASVEFIEKMPIRFHHFLPDLNYTAHSG